MWQRFRATSRAQVHASMHMCRISILSPIILDSILWFVATRVFNVLAKTCSKYLAVTCNCTRNVIGTCTIYPNTRRHVSCRARLRKPCSDGVYCATRHFYLRLNARRTKSAHTTRSHMRFVCFPVASSIHSVAINLRCKSLLPARRTFFACSPILLKSLSVLT